MLVRSLIGLLENGEVVLGGGTWKVKCVPATTARAAAASGTLSGPLCHLVRSLQTEHYSAENTLYQNLTPEGKQYPSL